MEQVQLNDEFWEKQGAKKAFYKGVICYRLCLISNKKYINMYYGKFFPKYVGNQFALDFEVIYNGRRQTEQGVIQMEYLHELQELLHLLKVEFDPKL